MAKGPQVRPPYTADDYEHLLKMHRNGASAERIALVLDQSTSSVRSHFQKHKPIWNAAGAFRHRRRERLEFSGGISLLHDSMLTNLGHIGERVEALTLLRDSEIDYEARIGADFAGPAAALAAQDCAGSPRPGRMPTSSSFAAAADTERTAHSVRQSATCGNDKACRYADTTACARVSRPAAVRVRRFRYSECARCLAMEERQLDTKCARQPRPSPCRPSRSLASVA